MLATQCYGNDSNAVVSFGQYLCSCIATLVAKLVDPDPESLGSYTATMVARWSIQTQSRYAAAPPPWWPSWSIQTQNRYAAAPPPWWPSWSIQTRIAMQLHRHHGGQAGRSRPESLCSCTVTMVANWREITPDRVQIVRGSLAPTSSKQGGEQPPLLPENNICTGSNFCGLRRLAK